ncbi:50S ribosomal protein L15e [Candidatus Woesearchaeota archaeon]|nr:50S ribosomal protein L15e [Candidatus Woesearchaeota archaeon]
MSLYKHIRTLWKSPKQAIPALVKERLIQWRTEPVTVKLERPTRLDRARSLGYKAKQGIVVVRQRVTRGGHVRPQIKGGRRPKRSGTNMNLRKNYQQIAEERAQKKFHNLSVLNSYWVGVDGKYFWYEVILVDPHHPVIQSDQHLQWLTTQKNQSRVYHGQTAAGRKGRGLVR